MSNVEVLYNLGRDKDRIQAIQILCRDFRRRSNRAKAIQLSERGGGTSDECHDQISWLGVVDRAIYRFRLRLCFVDRLGGDAGRDEPLRQQRNDFVDCPVARIAGRADITVEGTGSCLGHLPEMSFLPISAAGQDEPALALDRLGGQEPAHRGDAIRIVGIVDQHAKGQAVDEIASPS